MKKNNRLRRVDEARLPRRLLDLALLALLVSLIVELFNQGSLGHMLDYLRQRPLCFGLNYLLVFTSLCLTELFRARRALSWTIAALWIGLGFANYMVCRNRTQPLVSGDLLITREILGMAPLYFSWLEIILAAIALLLLIFGLVCLFARVPKRSRINYRRAVPGVMTSIVVVVLGCVLAVEVGFIPAHFGDRVDAYHDYGFATCFTFTFGRQGITQPDQYSGETVNQILEEVDAPLTTDAPVRRFGDGDDLHRPNIVFVQLESFFDVDDVIGAEFSRDPMPNFHKLLAENPNGMLYVPTIGGGTANVEFEVMSGMNMDFFGAGEAPYNTIIQEVTCETIANTLRSHGYYSTALHNNTGFFFSRNQVYANLGYDRFVPLEYMLYPKYNKVGWAHDRVLTDEILRVMENSDRRDLIFAISVESHGKYADTYESAPGDVEIFSLPEGAYLAPFQNYINVIPDVDAFVGEIIAAFERYDEPVLLVLYGDHLPALGLEADMLTTGDLYASRYIIWNNYGAEFDAPDLQSYRLSAELLRQLGITDGVMTRFHQAYAVDDESPEYLEKLQTLEYDLLYGEQNAYGEAGPYAPTDLQLGVDPIVIRSARVEYGRLLVKGDNFTEFSRILSGDAVLPTVFIDKETLAAVPTEESEPLVDQICVAQINNDGKELGRTDPFHVEK